MNVHNLMEKVIRAAKSAKILLDTGDKEGACDRASRQFNAAGAVLSINA